MRAQCFRRRRGRRGRGRRYRGRLARSFKLRLEV